MIEIEVGRLVGVSMGEPEFGPLCISGPQSLSVLLFGPARLPDRKLWSGKLPGEKRAGMERSPSKEFEVPTSVVFCVVNMMMWRRV